MSNSNATNSGFDLSRISKVQMARVELRDAPDYTNAMIESADYDGKPMSNAELDWLNEAEPEFVMEQAREWARR